MPPACPVEIRACGYHRHDEEFRDATGLPGGVLTLAANPTDA